MYRMEIEITGTAPLSQSRQHFCDMLEGESHNDYDKRTWREKCNYDTNGIIHVPAMAIKKAMDKAAQRLAIPDPDNRRAKMTKYFVSDVIPDCNLSIGIHKDQIGSITIGADRGEGRRVPAILPQTPQWGGRMSLTIMEEKIKPEMVERVLKCAGQSIGVGQFRPEKGGLNGRFKVEILEVIKLGE